MSHSLQRESWGFRARTLIVLLGLAAALVPASVDAQGTACDGNFHIVHELERGWLNAVDFTAEGEGWAVGADWMGADPDRQYGAPFVVRFDENSLDTSTFPSEPDRDAEFTDVDAITSSEAYLVGYGNDGGGQAHAFIYQWDSHAWVRMAIPSPGDSTWLRGVVAVGPNEVWAVGEMKVEGRFSFRTFILRYDGTSWERVFAPNPGGRYLSLQDVDATSPTQVWAVGHWGNQYPLLLRWNGLEWEKARMRGLDFKSDESFDSIDAVTPRDIWVVGNGRDRSLALHRVGKRWIRTRFHDVSGEPWLHGVAAGPTAVWTVGHWLVREQVYGNFAARWDGSWEEAEVEGRQVGELDDVAVDPDGNAWAIGGVGTPGGEGYDTVEVIEKACTP